MPVKNLDKARHMRAFEIVRQMHIHVESGNRVLHADALVLDHDRMADAFDADAIDGDLAQVSRALHVGDGFQLGAIHNVLS